MECIDNYRCDKKNIISSKIVIQDALIKVTNRDIVTVRLVTQCVFRFILMQCHISISSCSFVASIAIAQNLTEADRLAMEQEMLAQQAAEKDHRIQVEQCS